MILMIENHILQANKVFLLIKNGSMVLFHKIISLFIYVTECGVDFIWWLFYEEVVSGLHDFREPPIFELNTNCF